MSNRRREIKPEDYSHKLKCAVQMSTSIANKKCQVIFYGLTRADLTSDSVLNSVVETAMERRRRAIQGTWRYPQKEEEHAAKAS